MQIAVRSGETSNGLLAGAITLWNQASNNPNRNDVDGFRVGDGGEMDFDVSRKTQIGANTTLVRLVGRGMYEVYGQKYPVHSTALFRSPACTSVLQKPKEHSDAVDNKVVVRRMQSTPRSVCRFTSLKRVTVTGVVAGAWYILLLILFHLPTVCGFN
jgi:hypothetical protein